MRALDVRAAVMIGPTSRERDPSAAERIWRMRNPPRNPLAVHPAASAPRPGERGVALIIAMLMLMALSVLGAMLMMNVIIEKELSGHTQRHLQAVGVAEAGVSEALARIQSGDVPDNENPRMVSQIFLASPGGVPALGADSTAMATAQPAGQWMLYSTAARGAEALTVKYKTDPAATVIYRYDPALNPAIQTTSGMPIFTVTSTGRVGSTRCEVVSEVIRKPFSVQVRGGARGRGRHPVPRQRRGLRLQPPVGHSIGHAGPPAVRHLGDRHGRSSGIVEHGHGQQRRLGG
jgi:Tfp pilus assembly protein PilX